MAHVQPELLNKVMEMIVEADGSVKLTDLTPDTNLEKDLGFDSLTRMEAVMELEDEFGITIADEDLEKLTTVGAVAEYIAARLSEQPQP